MKLIGPCGACKKQKLFVRKRTYKHVHAGVIKSQTDLCGACYRAVRESLKPELR